MRRASFAVPAAADGAPAAPRPRSSGRVMLRRPALVFGVLKRMPCALVSSRASRTSMTLALEINAALPQRQHFAQAHAGEQCHHGPGRTGVRPELLTNARHVLNDHHFGLRHLGGLLDLADVLEHRAIALGVAQRLARAHGARGQSCGPLVRHYAMRCAIPRYRAGSLLQRAWFRGGGRSGSRRAGDSVAPSGP